MVGANSNSTQPLEDGKQKEINLCCLKRSFLETWFYCSLMGVRRDLSLSFDFRQAGVGRDELPLAVREMERSDRLLSCSGS